MNWVFISTSSPMVTVASIEDDRVLISRTESAPMRASGAVMRFLEELSVKPELYVADVGPGSFTGVKVGVTIAKTLGFAEGVKVAGLTSFDLISPGGAAAVPSRKGKHLVRDASGTDELDSDAKRVESAVKGFPSAENAAKLFSTLEPMDPVALLPNYVLEPNISTPKKL